MSLFPSTALISSIYSLYRLLEDDFSLNYLGLLIISFTIVAFFTSLYFIFPAKTSRNLPLIGFPILIGFSIVLYANIYKSFNSDAFALAFILIIAWFLYIFWYSSFDERDNLTLSVGNKFPEITLENFSKKSIRSSSFLGTKTVYVFYRGNWCPLCLGQIDSLINYHKKNKLKATNLVFISPQPHYQSQKLAEKYELEFNFLTDVNNQVAKQLGIDHTNGLPLGFQALGYKSDTVLPTVIVTNKKGEIIYADLTDNYRMRPSPETFLSTSEG